MATLSKAKLISIRDRAKAGHVRSQFNFGLAYLNGDGVKQDYDKAQKLFKIAASSGHKNAAFALENIDQLREDGFSGNELGLNYEFPQTMTWIMLALVFVFACGFIGFIVWRIYLDEVHELPNLIRTVQPTQEELNNPDRMRTGQALVDYDNFQSLYLGLYTDIKCGGLSVAERQNVLNAANGVAQLARISTEDIDTLHDVAGERFGQFKCKSAGADRVIERAVEMTQDQAFLARLPAVEGPVAAGTPAAAGSSDTPSAPMAPETGTPNRGPSAPMGTPPPGQ